MTEAEVQALENLATRFQTIVDRSPDALIYQLTFTADELRLLCQAAEAEATRQRCGS